MSKPTTKTELLTTTNVQFEKLWTLIDNMSEDEQNKKFCFEVTEKDKEAHWSRDENLRDVLMHLFEWHQLLIKWVDNNHNKSETIPFLPAPYTWTNYVGMNIGFFEKHQETSYTDSKKMLKESHKAVISLIESFTDEELFAKKHFSWTGTTSVGAYCISATSSHYDWAMKKIKRQIKALK